MSRNWLLAFLPVGALVVGVGYVPAADETPATKENIAAALKLTQAAADEYEIRAGTDKNEKPLTLRREPVLQWSNPDRGEVHGNVFVWTRDGRPMVAGCLFKWFSPHTHMTHEFQSLAEGPITAKFHGEEKWKTSEPGVKFADLPKAPAPADDDAKRLLQMKQLIKDFSGDKKEKEDANPVELRLLPQPVYRYSAPKQGIHSGGLFALVHGTDPEIWVLLEARGETAATAKWQFAAARMNNVDMNLRYKGEKVWSVGWMFAKDYNAHTFAYTKFMFFEIPDFLKDPPAKPKP